MKTERESWQVGVPDTRRPGFAEECRRQSLALVDDQAERDVLDWIESVSDLEGWSADED